MHQYHAINSERSFIVFVPAAPIAVETSYDG